VKSVGNALFRCAILAFPRGFRETYGAEMIAVFHERSLHRTAFSSVAESLDALAAGTRMRLEHRQLMHSAVVVTFAAAMIATTFALRDAQLAKPASRIEFSAHDAAGVFTVTVIDGRPVAATMDNISLPANRIVAEPDSIRLLAKDGRTAVALAFDAQRGAISWNSREPGHQ
jgi:hypothetical protein